MKDSREEWFDESGKTAVTVADVTSAAQALVRGHLSGPAAAHFLARALAAAALLGTDLEGEETLSLQMKCAGPLGGLNVECSAGGGLRGYTEKKILDAFDGMGAPDPKRVIGGMRLQVTRSVPGRILSQGIASSLDAYLAESLQRNARIFLEASVGDDSNVLVARGVMVEALPDGTRPLPAKAPPSLAVASRNILKRLGCENAVLRKTSPLAFACRCSPERAAATLAALGREERAGLPPTVCITCHMCGRTYTIPTGA